MQVLSMGRSNFGKLFTQFSQFGYQMSAEPTVPGFFLIPGDLELIAFLITDRIVVSALSE